MEKSKIYEKLDGFFEKFMIHKKSDEKLKNIDCYYIDSEEKKYIFACKVYHDKQSLFENWESDQDTDIALYLQNDCFSKNDIRWDIYFLLIYVGQDNLTLEEFHNIERDRFCCKKVVLSVSENTKVEEALNFKLPVTNNYYKLNKMENYITNESFLENLRKRASLDKEDFPDNLLADVGKNKIEIIEKLRVKL
ncbi:hypothetical protein SAMN02799630_04663 [Paenibacillus sp. UNCCL117]|uniref:ABC-three component system middle component 1 n=1 Tax=unclassified Paenibacillus TaxID=185978 RepID=UPI00088ECC21|nr:MULTISPECIES: ABC-three component system middle component 1 [unclassified Paenibacillus]SDE07007.1 hypothetical protein SAMN04488602_11832 [Paenibacillus sp. cl123]SFW59259.1 hypothetical protein SAMN02799630_04663 [Paenibacillus sp. UNCCL117]